MLNAAQSGRPTTRTAWWFVAFPGGALLMTTLAFNLFGDGVRDAFDPRGERMLQS
jgi:peptide/nickel transport system permease protein